MTNHIFSEVIQQLKSAAPNTIGVMDADGLILSCTNEDLQGSKWRDMAKVVNAAGDEVVIYGGKTIRALASFGDVYDYAVFVDGEDDSARCVCLMAHIALNCAKVQYEAKHDKVSFVKNILTDNILPGDIYIRAKELHFPTNLTRTVFLVRQVGATDIAAVEVLQNMFQERQQEFVISINETDIAVVKLVDKNADKDELYAVAQTIEDTLRNTLFLKTTIGIGSMCHHLRELADSFKEAQVAIEVGKVFDTEKSIIHYENLGIGRLIYQLPTTLCEIFLSEVFKKNSIDALDQDTLFTINKFFENNLNVSATSRKLFVHRNTLVYRLEKIKKITGLDLREFEDAIIFKVALMVKKYLSSRENRML